jgi:hypothetical protein
MRRLSNDVSQATGGSSDRFAVSMTRLERALAVRAVSAVRDEWDEAEFRAREGADRDTADRLLTALARAGTQAAPRDAFRVEMTADELLLLSNALNDVLHGMVSEHRAEHVAAERQIATSLLDDVVALIDDPLFAVTPERVSTIK